MITNRIKKILIFYLLLLLNVEGLPTVISDIKGIITLEVPLGEDVIVACRSNDEKHNFNYWSRFENNDIIGPTNDYDKSKYRFSILPGNLTIKSFAKEDEGSYNCVSRGTVLNDVNIKTTKIKAQENWEEAYENDSTVNLFRVVIIFATLIILAGGSYLVYKIWKDRYKYPHYLSEQDEDDDDDSAEELFRTPGTSGTSSSSKGVEKMEKMDKSMKYDNSNISTDFGSILDAVNSK